MSNGARHALGVVAGVLVTVVSLGCMLFALDRAQRMYVYFRLGAGDKALVTLAIVVAGLLLGLAAGSRLSPFASLVPGVVYGTVGLVYVLAPTQALHWFMHVKPARYARGFTTLGTLGVFLLLGTALFVASLPPSRWQGRRRPAHGGPLPGGRPLAQPPHQARHQAPPPALPQYGPPRAPEAPQPYAPPSAPGAYTPPSGAPEGQPFTPPASDAPPPYAPPSVPPGPPQPYTPPSASEAPPAAPPAGRKPGDDEEPGEWTRMYGGNR
ncbi:hypothetical protein BTM25_13350 [Actinomadura rubteroloni]|uniref:Uncharacterized protein n=1 Tax=Actinomadura rubteroloni TaxID=1926885 RepID=A0A2P4UPF0_9ACTN|nr:hypothetical protein [Actinomadura rubteroloni]POM26927.1 hypothetical protein BTM25_13350 [Actinomadura rubteroloni]